MALNRESRVPTSPRWWRCSLTPQQLSFLAAIRPRFAFSHVPPPWFEPPCCVTCIHIYGATLVCDLRGDQAGCYYALILCDLNSLHGQYMLRENIQSDCSNCMLINRRQECQIKTINSEIQFFQRLHKVLIHPVHIYALNRLNQFDLTSPPQNECVNTPLNHTYMHF